jgi:electron transport complex protein RnfG
LRENIKLGIILLIVTAIAGLFLGGAYVITKEPIAKQALLEKNQAMKEILPMADKFELSNVVVPEGTTIKEVYEGFKGSEKVGYAIKVTPKGFGGLIDMMVGITVEGKIGGIKIIALSETPGLGANSTNINFYGQYKDKGIDPKLEVIKSGAPKDNEIQAITGATITSRAVTSGVNDAIDFYTSSLKGGSK